MFVVLRADDHGEGGTFALYSFLCRHLDFHNKFTVQNTRMDRDTRYCAQGSRMTSRTKNFLERSSGAQTVLMLGTCMVIGDGALTPAASGKWLYKKRLH